MLQFCTPTARQGGGRGPAAQQRGGRDLYVNFKKIYLRGSLWREPAAPLAGGRLPPKDPAQIIFFKFTYKSLPPRCWAAGPLPPPCREVGVQNCKL